MDGMPRDAIRMLIFRPCMLHILNLVPRVPQDVGKGGHRSMEQAGHSGVKRRTFGPRAGARQYLTLPKRPEILPRPLKSNGPRYQTSDAACCRRGSRQAVARSWVKSPHQQSVHGCTQYLDYTAVSPGKLLKCKARQGNAKRVSWT